MAIFDLDSPCSLYFSYRDLIECGETWRDLSRRAPVANLPAADATWDGIAGLAREILDPLREQFGHVVLTYGFAGRELVRRIAGRIAPALDQHAGVERRSCGALICARRGQACDLYVPGVDALVVGEWVRTHLPFDRLYLYGADRPLHVSHGPEQTKRVYAIMRHGGRVLPREIRGEVTAVAAVFDLKHWHLR